MHNTFVPKCFGICQQRGDEMVAIRLFLEAFIAPNGKSLCLRG